MVRESAPEQLRGDLARLFEDIRTDLDRIEMLTVAMNVFNRPIPDYEPSFRHLQHSILDLHALR